MTTGGSKSGPALGFLSVVEHAQHGLYGGLLVLNMASRPLEFHCTTPVKANRAQQILYGPTLLPYLYGEQIGRTLLNSASRQLLALLTDQEPILAVREHIDIPTALVLDSSNSAKCKLATFSLGINNLAVEPQRDDDRRRIVESLAPWSESLELLEPFTRIREAIEEAQLTARAQAA